MFSKSFMFLSKNTISSARTCPSSPFFKSSRTFTFQAARLAKTSAKRASKATTKPVNIQSTRSPVRKNATDIRFIGRRTGSLAELDRKVTQQGEVVLFKASSQRAYIFGAYGIAAFAFGYAVVNSSIGLADKRAQLAYWQKSLNVGVCVVMSVMGTVFISRTSRLIRDIIAFDSKGQTLLKVNVRSVVPFRKPYTITLAPNQILFSRKLTVGSHPQLQGIYISFFKNPLKAINFTFFRIFIAIRRIFTQEDFIMMEMQGHKGAFRVGLDGYVSHDLLAIGHTT